MIGGGKKFLSWGCVLVIRRKPPKEHYTVITGLFILPKARQKTELFLTRRAGSQAAGEEGVGVGTLNKQQLEACK